MSLQTETENKPNPTSMTEPPEPPPSQASKEVPRKMYQYSKIKYYLGYGSMDETGKIIHI